MDTLGIAARTPFVVPEGNAASVERITALEPSWAICDFRYLLDKRIFDAALIPVFSDESWLNEQRYQDMLQGKEPYGAKQISSMSRDVAVPGCGGEAVGIAQVVGQCGRSKPDARTPLPGLYIVGCDAGGRGAGTHQAVDSGFNVAGMVAQDLA